MQQRALNLNIGSHAATAGVRCLHGWSRQLLRCCSCLLVNFWIAPMHTIHSLKGEFFTWKLSVQLTPEIPTPFLKGFCCLQNRKVTVEQLATSFLNTFLRLWGGLYHEYIFSIRSMCTHSKVSGYCTGESIQIQCFG